MKIVKLVGRLGNQMFLYAFGKALEYYSKDEVYFDTSFYNVNPDVSLELENLFELKLKIASESDICKIKNKGGLFNRLFQTRVKEKIPNKFCKNLLNKRTDAYYAGYFQCEQYFCEIQDLIKMDFTARQLQNKDLSRFKEEIDNYKCPIFVHVRRGDYVTLEKENIAHWLCDISYYKKAMDFMKKKYPQCVFVAVSDEPQWVYENLNFGHPIKIYSTNTILDFFIMQACKHAICANSSFSWWAAWLMDNPNKTIVAPDPWFEPEADTDIVPDRWIKFPRF